MRGLQEHQLFLDSQQKKVERQAGAEKALPEMQNAYGA